MPTHFHEGQFHSVKRNEEETINKRGEWIIKYTTTTNKDYLKNCVFIDESAFRINLKRSMAWSAKGTTPIVTVPNTRAKTHTILGAISVMVWSTLLYGNHKVSQSKKRKRGKTDDQSKNDNAEEQRPIIT
jgi:hypothetical protein